MGKVGKRRRRWKIRGMIEEILRELVGYVKYFEECWIKVVDRMV